ncbi:nitrite/sulfite reductase domain-containing protein [Helicovermis profundi]|uniref:NAD(P)/FAD-dependent oxidoreductase n=1 Tax=Helicovermis profundi TaxID=3065157 RepID=A0AAU9EY24_9FIRM|nr:NAD(P)/FAD-dependent oxidoreductase [Clostridia bacterium S502]
MNPKNAVLQKVRNNKRTYGITPRIPGGFVTPEILIKISEVSKKYNGTIKITSGQRITILGLNAEDIDNIWQELDMEPAILSSYSVKNVEICPASFCKRSRQNSMKLGLKLEKRFYGAPCPNRTKIGVVGCLNGCSSVHAKDIGLLANEEGFIVVAGGSAGYNQRLSDTIARNLSEDEAFCMVESIYEVYNEKADFGQKLGPFIDKIGLDSFKELVFKVYNSKLTKKEKINE